jgi:hypothetical protein
MSATALKSTKRRFSSLNHQNFEFFRLVPRSPTHTGLICGKTLEPNISSLGPFKEPRNRFPAWRAGMSTLFDVPARQAGGIDSWAPETFTNSGSECVFFTSTLLLLKIFRWSTALCQKLLESNLVRRVYTTVYVH